MCVCVCVCVLAVLARECRHTDMPMSVGRWNPPPSIQYRSMQHHYTQ